jgi:hypothetical protein
LDEVARVAEGIGIGPNTVQFEDDFIVIRIFGYDRETGQGDIVIERKQAEVGFYYIYLTFDSGNTNRLDFDGANPNIGEFMDFQATYRNDLIVKVEAKKVR